jgi:hypothetical protein
VDLRVSPLILQAHMFLHVLHPHHIPTTLFLVPLNERESRGTVTDRRYCTVQLVTVVLLLDSESRLLPATRIPTTTVYWKTPVQKLQLFRYASPQNLNLRNRHLATSSTYNSTGITSHVLTTLQHVAYNMIVICHHVATAVAGPNSQVGAVLAFGLHCHCQWHEGFYDRSRNTLISRKQIYKIQSNLD